MMEDLARIALVGTAKHAAAGVCDLAHPAESLLAPLAAEDREQAFLLRAGARAAFEQCGLRPAANVAAVEPSLPDERPYGSPRLLGLLQNAIDANNKELLNEFLQQMESAGVLLPPELLPPALGIKDADVRARLLPVVGRRGSWLSQFNPDWEWVTAGIGTLGGQDREALKATWETGTLPQRCEALRTLRRLAPDETRAWLEAVLDKEKAANRLSLLGAFEVGLSAEDEPFLESRLDDRSENVRSQAAALLARIPTSALAARMRQRGESLLQLQSSNSSGAANQLVCHPPEEIDKSWERDGIPKKAPPGRGKRATWAEAVLSTIPPEHWAETFGLDPEQLLAITRADDFMLSIVTGWTRAAIAFAGDGANSAWLRPLWEFWLAFEEGKGTYAQQAEQLEHLNGLLAAMTPAAAESALLPLLVAAERARESARVLDLLQRIRRPWSDTFGRQLLASVRTVFRRPAEQHAYLWSQALLTAGLALPPSCFEAALAPWEIAKDSNSPNLMVERGIEQFLDTIRIRQSFYEELARQRQPASLSPT